MTKIHSIVMGCKFTCNLWLSNEPRYSCGSGKKNITRLLCLPPLSLALAPSLSLCSFPLVRLQGCNLMEALFLLSNAKVQLFFFCYSCSETGKKSLWESPSKHCHTTQSLTATCKFLDSTSRFTVASSVVEALLFLALLIRIYISIVNEKWKEVIHFTHQDMIKTHISFDGLKHLIRWQSDRMLGGIIAVLIWI